MIQDVFNVVQIKCVWGFTVNWICMMGHVLLSVIQSVGIKISRWFIGVSGNVRWVELMSLFIDQHNNDQENIDSLLFGNVIVAQCFHFLIMLLEIYQTLYQFFVLLSSVKRFMEWFIIYDIIYIIWWWWDIISLFIIDIFCWTIYYLLYLLQFI